MPVTAEQEDRLFKAADAGQLEEFQAAAAELGGDDIKQLKADNGADCLHISAHGGRTELCKYLLEQLHFDVNMQEGAWPPRTALWGAAPHLVGHAPPPPPPPVCCRHQATQPAAPKLACRHRQHSPGAGHREGPR